MTNIIKFQVKNYRSIKDSGVCYLADGITVLAGKNESGKTSLLQALEDFDTNQTIRKDAVPISSKKENPEIFVTFEVEKETVIELLENAKVNKKEIEITLKKDFDNKYTLENVSEDIFDNIKKENSTVEKKCKKIFDNIVKELKSLDITIENDETYDTTFVSKIQAVYPKITSPEKKQKIELLVNELSEQIKNILDLNKIEEKFVADFQQYIPYFIFFNTYKDQKIPNEVPFAELETNEFVQDLVQVSNLDIKLIKDPARSREQATHERKLNIELVKEYEQFWEQDMSNIQIQWKDNKLFFWVTENDEFYPPELRSKGKQWHLAFYIKITARAREDKPNVLLIDEPGLFLHAKAQKDILKKLEESSKNMQVIYSTHSPYLIDSNHLNRVRLVEREKEGTQILKLHAKADKETLTPILTAIGDDLSQGIRVDKKNSFVVEGISDYFYMHAFKILFEMDVELNIIPGCGDNLPAIGGILFGWGLEPKFILDTDTKTIQKKLKEKLSIEEKDIIPILDKKGMIEEIFSEDDFKKHIIGDESADLSKGYIKVIKANGNKELLARKFFEAVKSEEIKTDDLSQETTDNIKKLLDRIKAILE
jgi:predicted ATP-dependent endonuclease of OLD family